MSAPQSAQLPGYLVVMMRGISLPLYELISRHRGRSSLAVAVTGWPPAPAAVLLVAGAMAPAPAMLVAMFLAYGCPHTIAACSWMTEKLSGVPVGELVNFAPDWVTDELNIPVEKAGKLLILQDALRKCFDDWKTGIKGNDGNYVDR